VLPGWDSAAVTSAYARWFTYAGFVALFLLGVFEIFGHIYSVHETTLRDAAAAREADDKRAQADARISEAQRGAAEANEGAALAQRDAADANIKSEGFRLDIAKANESAAKAVEEAAKSNETAEREKLARLQLEARLADRTLTVDQRTRLVKEAAPFRGTSIDVVVYGDTSDVLGISRVLIEALQEAGWSVQVGYAAAGGVAVKGILIGTRSNADANTSRASAALISALQSMGLASGPWQFEQMQLGSMFNTSVSGSAPVRMFIGSK
jgi:hypothetical protein